MTNEEAYKYLENLQHEFTRHREAYAEELISANGIAILAIEKQIPKKPYIDNENGVYEKEYCPTCHRSLFPNDHHCRCGQRLDWSKLK